MAKDVHYFKHDADAHTDLMVKAMLKKYGWLGYGWWWYIVEKLRGQDNYQLEYDVVYFESIAEDLRVEGEEVKAFIDSLVTFKLLKKVKGSEVTYFHSPRLSRDMAHYDDVRLQRQTAGQTSAARRYGKGKQGPTPVDTSTILDPKLASMVKCYEENIRMATPFEYEELKLLCDELPDGWFQDATKEAVVNGVPKLSYIKATLKRWQAEGRNNKKPVPYERQEYTLD